MSPTSSTCWPTCSRSREPTRSASSPTAGPRRHPRVAGRHRADGARREGEEPDRDRQDDRGEDRPDRRGGRDQGAPRSQGQNPARRDLFHAAAGPRPEDGTEDLAGARRLDGRGAEAGGRGRAATRAVRARAEDGGEHPARARGQADRGHRARCWAVRSRSCSPWSSRSASIPPRIRSPRRGARAAAARRCATSTSSHGRGSPCADRPLRRAALGRRGCRAGADEGDGDLERGVPRRPARRAAGLLRQPSSALHRVEEPQCCVT